MKVTGAGHKCPHCGVYDSKVFDSRHGDDFVRRRRRCQNAACRQTFTTVELVVQGMGFEMPSEVKAALEYYNNFLALRREDRIVIEQLMMRFRAINARLPDGETDVKLEA